MRLTIRNTNGYDCYPFEGPVPVRILADHPLFYVLEVMPHANGCGRSAPYVITLDKWEIGRSAKLSKE